MQSLSRIRRLPPPPKPAPIRKPSAAVRAPETPPSWVTDFFPRLRALLETISQETGVPIEQIRGGQKVRHIVDARWRFMRAAYAQGHPLTLIGRAVNRDHTTVCYALGLLSDRKPRR